MFATSLALISAAFTGRDRGIAFGAFGAIIGAAVAVGPLVGGAITSGIGWRWIFFVNVPIGVVAIALTLAKVDQSKDPRTRRVDWFGFVTFSASLFMLVFALVRGNSLGWSSTEILVLLIGSVVFMVVFLIAELRLRDPMLDLSLFRRPAVAGASICAFTLAASIFALFLYLTLYIQDDLGFSPLGAGVRFLPITLLSFFVAPFSGRLTERVQARYLLGAGLVLVGVSQLLLGTTHPDSTWTQLLPGFVVGGAGIGMVNPVLASSAVAVVPPERAGMASGANSTFRQVGIATGIAGLGAVFQSQIVHRTVSLLSSSAAGQAVIAHGGSQLKLALTAGQVQAVARSPQIPAPAKQALLHAYRVGFSGTFNDLALIGAVVAFVGAILSYVLVRQRDFVAFGDSPVSGGRSAGHPSGPGDAESPERDGLGEDRQAEVPVRR